MSFDSYRSPEAESLLRSARERFTRCSRDGRLFTTELCGAALYLALAGMIAVVASSPRQLS
ncbi:MAG TPA: hypothetical protein VG223_06865, partial [Solirubrobacteraceae bacterium]|nr:hypothetical protein [Solirubrobacteraceae bacterium]